MKMWLAGEGEDPHNLPTQMRPDGTLTRPAPGQAGRNSSSPILTVLDEENKARSEAKIAAEEAKRDELRASRARNVSAALIKALGRKGLSLDAQVLMRSRLVEAQSARLSLLERAQAERDTESGERAYLKLF